MENRQSRRSPFNSNHIRFPIVLGLPSSVSTPIAFVKPRHNGKKYLLLFTHSHSHIIVSYISQYRINVHNSLIPCQLRALRIRQLFSTLFLCQGHFRFLKRGSSTAAGQRSYVLYISASNLPRAIYLHSLNASLMLKLTTINRLYLSNSDPYISGVFAGSFNGPQFTVNCSTHQTQVLATSV